MYDAYIMSYVMEQGRKLVLSYHSGVISPCLYIEIVKQFT